MFYMAAPQARGKSAGDNIFAANGRAVALAKEIGEENVVNATIGAILNDAGELVVLDVVKKAYEELTPFEWASYSPISGLPDYLNICIDECFGESRPEGYIRAVATPGGSGAIHHAIHNYTAPGDEVLVTDWHWGAYKTLIDDPKRVPGFYQLFTADGHFNKESLRTEVRRVLKKQNSVLVILNGIANNPTGYSLTDDEWKEAVDVLSEEVKGTEKKAILLPDVAYLDYSGERQASRRFFKCFGGLPQNVLVVIAYSLSKGFTLYGQRLGAMIGVTSDKDVAQEFADVNQYASRATWSNCNTAAQNLMIHIYKDPAKAQELIEERLKYYRLIQDRAAIFMAEAKEVGLKVVPYVSGFFISIPVKESKKVSDFLEKKHVFLVPMEKGLRLAVCSVPTRKMKGIATKVAEAIKEAGIVQ